MMSLVGIFAILLVAYLASAHRSQIKWRTVGGAFAIQLAIGAFVLYVPFGKDVLIKCISLCRQRHFLRPGRYSFSYLVTLVRRNMVLFLPFMCLTVIIFFSSLIAVLYHIGVMKFVIGIIGGGLQKLLGTSRPESMSAAANIFVGQTEAPLVVRPFIPTMTRSELFAVMVGGLVFSSRFSAGWLCRYGY